MKNLARIARCWKGNRHAIARVTAVALALLSARPAFVPAQDFASMPDYSPARQVSGTIRIRGDEHQQLMLRNWERAFRNYQPSVSFDDRLTSTVHGIPALTFDLADVALLGREIAPLESLSFRRMFRHDPMAITIATGSYDTQYEAYALGVFVNKRNPISRLTLQQLASIFGCGYGVHIRTWGQLGLKGEWAGRRIHILGYPSGNNIAAFFALKVFQTPTGGGPTLPNGPRWSCGLKEYANSYDNHDKPIVSSDAYMMQGLKRDPYAIAYSGIKEATSEVKSVALAPDAGAAYVPFSLDTVGNRTYPLTRSVYAYVNKASDQPLSPAVEEFLRFILSRQGQSSIAQQEVFLPLTSAEVTLQIKKLQ